MKSRYLLALCPPNDSAPDPTVPVAGHLIGRDCSASLERLGDLGLGCIAVRPCEAPHALPGLEDLVFLEKVMNRFHLELREVGEILEVPIARIARRHADHFGIGPILIGHLKERDGARANEASWKGRLLEQDQRV